MRVVVIGTSGSGKTTFADRLAKAADLARIDLDAINWQRGWVGLHETDPEELVRRVVARAEQPAWVSCGNYRAVRALLLARATHVVWLDYSRALTMARVIRRSFARAVSKKELWPGTGNREHFRRWLDKDHPIRWAWDTYHRRRRDYEAIFADPDRASLVKHQLRHPREAQPLIDRLAAEHTGLPI